MPRSVPPDRLQQLLCAYDPAKAEVLVTGFRLGFELGGVDFPPGDVDFNLPSCELAPEVVDAYVAAECQAGRIAGPFSSPA